MKKVFLAVLLVVGITAFAQEKDLKRNGKERLSSEQKVDFQVKKMTKDLDLNDKQAEQVKVLVAKQVQKRDEKRAEMKENKDKKRAEMKANMETEQAAISADMKKILTPDQYTKWEKTREEKKEKMKERILERRDNKEIK